eukprot:gene1664-2311_t
MSPLVRTCPCTMGWKSRGTLAVNNDDAALFAYVKNMHTRAQVRKKLVTQRLVNAVNLDVAELMDDLLGPLGDLPPQPPVAGEN